MRSKLALWSVAVALAGAPAWADGDSNAVQWSNVTSGDASWGELTNWQTAGGAAVAVAPTNGEDVVFPAMTVSPYVKRVTTGKTLNNGPTKWLEYPAVDVTIGKLTGSDAWTIRVAEETYGNQDQLKRFFSVNDPNDFYGFWEPNDGKTMLKLNATADFEPKMAHVSTFKRPEINVPTAGTSAEVKDFHRAGAFTKSGAGTLAVRSFANEAFKAYVKEGSLVFRDKNSGAHVDVAALLAEAAADFDASKDSTLTTVSSNGYLCVTEWRSANGSALVARAEYFKATAKHEVVEAHAPFICADRSPTGLPMVDFGAMNTESEATYGPRGCYFTLPSSVNVREMFAVVDSPRGMTERALISSGGHHEFMNEGGSKIFCGYGGTERVHTGNIRIDNERVRNDGRTPASMTGTYTFSVGTRDLAVPISFVGTRERYVNHTGGFRLGELLLFTRSFTDAERTAINAYLRRKWQIGDEPLDLQGVFVAQGATLGVESNAEVRVEALHVDGDLTLAGGGRLVTTMFDGTNVNLGAQLEFAKPRALDDAKPADGAYVWLDATDDASFAYNTGYGTDKDYVESWSDCRAGVSVAASCPHRSPGMPFRVAEPLLGGRKVVDFGQRIDSVTAGTASSLGLPNYGTEEKHRVYAGFCVMRATVSGKGRSRVFGGSGMSGYAAGTIFASSDYVNGYAASATVTVNGNLVDAHDRTSATQVFDQTDRFHVVAFTATEPIMVDMLAQDRIDNNIYTNYCGNMQIAEYILYHRKITPAERRNTEAYLMKKWLDKTHPYVQTKTLGAVKVSGERAGLGSGAGETLSVLQVEGAMSSDGTFVKSGAGTVKTSFFNPGNVSNLVVEAGTLEFANATITDDSRFHFDASDPSSFECEVADEGAKTNVIHWADVRANGVTTYCPLSAYQPGEKDGQLVFVRPVLRSVEMRPGVYRPAVDFGKYSGYYKQHQQDGSSGLNMSLDGKTQTTFSDILEVFTVYSDAPSSQNFIFTDSGKYHYHRNGAKLLANNAGTQVGAKDGYHAVDGTEVVYDYSLPSGFHVINFAPTNKTSVGTMAIDRTSNGGACLIAESFGFNYYLPVARRKFIERQLMHKWFDAPKPIWTNAYDTVTVAAGATLKIDASEVLSARRFEGGGTVDAQMALSGPNAALAFVYRSKTDVDGLHVSDRLALNGDVTVSVTTAAGAKVEKGQWPLVTATGGVDGLDLERLTLVTDFPSKWIAFLFVRDGILWLHVEPRGLALIVR